MNVIEVENVGKMFRLGSRVGDLRERVGTLLSRDRAAERAATDFWALRDVSFSVAQGESFGIIGHNGSGKSTMLKLLTGILRPNRGTFHTRGRVAALIEVGAGFHPELTGRENIYLNGSILGMKKREIDSRFDEIVAFSELEQFIDTPVKRYSSGMYMRLGFSVAAHVNPDIVLVDEVLAVGDEAFQTKCMRRMQDLRKEGRTVVFISHSMDAVSALCQRVMLLSHGQVLKIAGPREVISAYRTSLASERSQRLAARQGGAATEPSAKELEILNVRVLDARGHECDKFAIGDMAQIECTFRANVRMENPAFGVALHRSDGLYIFGPNTVYDNVPIGPLEGEGRFILRYDSLPLMQGMYHLTVATFHADNTHQSIDACQSIAGFEILSDTLNHGTVALPHSWEILPGNASTRPRLSERLEIAPVG